MNIKPVYQELRECLSGLVNSRIPHCTMSLDQFNGEMDKRLWSELHGQMRHLSDTYISIDLEQT